MKARKLTFKILTIAALAAGAFVFFFEWRWREQQAVDARYREALAQLVRSRNDNEAGSVSYASSLNELNDLIVRKSNGDPGMKKKLKEDVSQRFVQWFRSHGFDLNQGTNVELESTVAANWEEYSDHLTRDPDHNVWILYQYSLALQNLAEKEPGLIQSASLVATDGTISYYGKTNDKNAAGLLQKLNSGYSQHIEILRSVPGEVNKKYLLTSFCWYRNAINNSSLAGHVFSYNKAQVNAEELRCREAGQSIAMFTGK